MSRGRRTEPPHLATRVLRALLPDDRRGRSIVGDLMEEWHARPAGAGRDLWYVGECVRVGLRYVLVRRHLPGERPVGAPPRPRRAPPLLPWDDLRLALRSAARTPGMSALTVLALGVGVAAPTLMFSLLVGVTRELPVSEPEELVQVGWRYTPTIVRGAGFEVLRPFLDGAGADELASAGVFNELQADLSGGEGFPERRRAAAVTPGVFSTLGVTPALGRAIGPEDVTNAQSGPTVVISDALWRARFGSDPEALGRTLRVDGRPHTVVGVMPPRFAFPDGVDLWLPLDVENPGPYRFAELIGRLADGASLEAVRARTASVMTGLRDAGVIGTEVRGGLDAAAWSERAIDRNGRRMLLAMLVIVSFVLVIACANVAHLFLARALAQRRATAVRLALGSGRWRVVRQHLAESGVLAVLGGLLGVGVAALGIRWLAVAMAPRLSWWMEIRLDPVVALFAGGLVVCAALFTAVLPALHARRLDVTGPLQSGTRGSSAGKGVARATGGLVVMEVALTCTLLVVAGLLTRGALRNLEVEAGYETASVMVGSFELRPDRYPDGDAMRAFHRELLDAVDARPDVAAATLASHLPGIYTLQENVEIEGAEYERPEDRPRTHVARIAPGYLEVLGVAPVRGRALSWADGRDEPLAALVNEPFVRRHMEGRDPIGVRVRVAPDEGEDPAAAEERWATIVGVVLSLGMNGGLDPDDTGIYLPLAAEPPRTVHLLARTRSGTEPEALVPAARADLAALDDDVALSEPRSLRSAIQANRDMESLFATLFTFFGVSGLLLAGVGLYGLTAFTVGRRVRELGIRSALGARPGSLVWTAVRGGALQIAAGLVLGLGLAVVVAPLLGGLFMGYEPRDPVAYAVVAATLLFTGMLATLGPARRATSMDVTEVLRAE
jgi:putative ABC transport system permease protein